ncbi:hypothetical protein [Actinophytocola sp.]|uniref:hypothetical protein n=1 Tax=Actinophytocola sp. TaxID=1872138 RepID=UPI00389AFD04
MTTKKVTITLPEETHAKAIALAKKAGLPFSTWLAQTAEHEVRVQEGLEAMREWDEEMGPPSAEAEAWVDRQFAELEGQSSS